MSQLIASNYLNKLWITFSSKHTLWTSSAKTPHLTMSTMIGMSKWRMESASAKPEPAAWRKLFLNIETLGQRAAD